MKLNRNWPLLALPVAAAIAVIPYLPSPERHQAALGQNDQTSQTQTSPAPSSPSASSTAPSSTPQNSQPAPDLSGSQPNDAQSSPYTAQQNDPNWNPWQRGGPGDSADNSGDPFPFGTQNDPSASGQGQLGSGTARSGTQANSALRQVYDKAVASAVRVNVGDSGIGSGFFMSADGLILTAAHVALGEPGAKLSVTTQDGQNLAATLVGYDEVRDLAVLKVQGSNLPALKLAASTPAVGAGVVAIGNSRGSFDGGRAGAVTALNVSLDATFPSNMVQSSMPLAPGDSGGPVLNAQGEVVGVSTAISNRGGNFASYFVPVTSSSALVRELVSGVRRGVPVLGISVADAQQSTGKSGVLVTAVSPGLGAATAGLKGGTVREFRDASGNVQQDISGADIIVGVDGRSVSTPSALVTYLRGKQVGDTVALRILRGDQTLTVNVKLSAKPTNQG
ncbi:S1C family serine protease [Deinococcus sp. KNUC1210]|uniref:S1C family serine protease n=1 Tax=Deinococcus sp. KNUC1210 TaxID=2917691 RepID=UPI001EF088BF|nr:trypsin-like peptidase domain-containing protein [Deinococcus sp. KNUC1210]ULH14528.1 S1C family serine protease [Deinococcus sp. KNUC1210]